jgi:translation elongation factor EF-Tu-like GTPase
MVLQLATSDIMEEVLAHIEAELTFLPTEHGGRKSPVYSGYRPQFYYGGEDWDAAHDYPEVDTVTPGQTVRARLTFMCPQNHVGRVFVGMSFLLREGNRVVGYGHVTNIDGLKKTTDADNS